MSSPPPYFAVRSLLYSIFFAPSHVTCSTFSWTNLALLTNAKVRLEVDIDGPLQLSLRSSERWREREEGEKETFAIPEAENEIVPDEGHDD